MSAFLGPIHYWLFNKIKLVEARETEVANAFAGKYGDGVSDIVKKNASKYGGHFGDTPLEELIGDAMIHGYLSSAIQKVETREAALLAALLARYGEDAKKLALETAKAHGQKLGKASSSEVNPPDATADDVYRAIRNTFLDGMPCDHVVEITNVSDKELVEVHTDCLHREYWGVAGAPEGFMCQYLGAWIDGFVEGLGGAKHARGKTLVAGDAHCEDRYTC